MKIGLILLALAVVYLVGQLLMIWRTRNDVPRTPPGGWRKGEWDDDHDDWPGRGA